jgi:ACS family allantoate permease-like MFS transporter
MDPQTYFFFFVVIANSLPNGGTTTFGNLVYVSFGFTSLETLTKGTVPQQALSIVWFLIVGYTTLKKPNLRCKLNLLKRSMLKDEIVNDISVVFMMLSLLPAFSGMLALALLPTKASLLWTKWGLYLMSELTRFGFRKLQNPWLLTYNCSRHRKLAWASHLDILAL